MRCGPNINQYKVSCCDLNLLLVKTNRNTQNKICKSLEKVWLKTFVIIEILFIANNTTIITLSLKDEEDYL
jgi:hypothetical protein